MRFNSLISVALLPIIVCFHLYTSAKDTVECAVVYTVFCILCTLYSVYCSDTPEKDAGSGQETGNSFGVAL